MFNFWSFKGLSALVSSGLGGGSLIYANVMIRKPSEWFEPDGFPLTRADLEPHYDAVEKVLSPQTYPFDTPPYAGTAKTQAFKEAAQAAGVDWELPKLAVTFRAPGVTDAVPGAPFGEPSDNLHESHRQTCRLCGECDVGCNYGSKNTLDYNYLSLAKKQGATIKTLTEVLFFEPASEGGYDVFYRTLDPDAPSSSATRNKENCTPIRAKRLVLAAGTLASPYLLMKNRAAFPKLSSALGTRFSGNGDYLGRTLLASDRHQECQ